MDFVLWTFVVGDGVLAERLGERHFSGEELLNYWRVCITPINPVSLISLHTVAFSGVRKVVNQQKVGIKRN